MKKVYQTIASLSLSLLAVAAFGQGITPSHSVAMHNRVKAISYTPGSVHYKVLPALHAPSNNNARVESLQPLELEYWNSDFVLGGYTAGVGGDFTTWVGNYQNARFKLSDSGNGVGHVKNYDILNTATVAFDTLVDPNGLSQNVPGNQSVVIDTIFFGIDYLNTSGLNDTIIFSIIPVQKGLGAGVVPGYPNYTGVPYDKDTVVIVPGVTISSLSTQDSESFFSVPIRPCTITASSARYGHNFAVKASIYGSKLDSLGLLYQSGYVTCTYDYTNETQLSTVGIPLSHFGGYNGAILSGTPHANSFDQGNYYNNRLSDFGNGTSLDWPDSAYGIALNEGGYYFTEPTTCAGDTGMVIPQNWVLGVSLQVNVTTAVNQVAADKSFSIDQNYPNPFNKNTQITYNLTQSSDVVFTVYDMTGRELVNNTYSTVTPGQHVISLQANQFTPGIYFYTFNVAGTAVTKKMVITQ